MLWDLLLNLVDDTFLWKEPYEMINEWINLSTHPPAFDSWQYLCPRFIVEMRWYLAESAISAGLVSLLKAGFLATSEVPKIQVQTIKSLHKSV